MLLEAHVMLFVMNVINFGLLFTSTVATTNLRDVGYLLLDFCPTKSLLREYLRPVTGSQ